MSNHSKSFIVAGLDDKRFLSVAAKLERGAVKCVQGDLFKDQSQDFDNGDDDREFLINLIRKNRDGGIEHCGMRIWKKSLSNPDVRLMEG